MLSASLYIIVCSAKNRLLVRLRRLREPRYLIGAIAGAAYFYFAVFRAYRGGEEPARPADDLAGALCYRRMEALPASPAQDCS